MSDRTQPNIEWAVADENGKMPTWERIAIAVLMDIRRELRAINATLRCSEFQAIPRRLDRIARNTTKPKRKVATK